MRLTRTTLLLLLANAACALVIWWAMPDGKDAAVRGLAFPTEPSLVEIEGASGPIRLERAGGGWQVTRPYAWPANPWEVQRLLGELTLAREGDSRLVDPGLPPAGPDRWKIRVTGAGGNAVEATVTVHGATPGSRTARLDGGERGIATAGEALIKALAAPPESFRTEAVFDIPAFEVRAVGVRATGADGQERRWGLILESRDRVGKTEVGDAWRFEAPLDLAADAERTPRAIAALTDLRVTRFLPRREVAPEKPALRVSIESASRRQVLMAWPAKEGFREACLEDNPGQPFLVEAQALARWENPESELRSRQPCDFEPAEVRGIVLTSLADGRSLTLHRIDSAGATGRWEMPVLAGSTATRRLEVAVGRAQQFLRLLTGLRASETVDAAPGASWHRVELEFANGRLAYELAADPAGGRILVRQPAGGVVACPSEQTLAPWVSVTTDTWRTETLARLAAGSQVARITLSRADGKTVADARRGADGRWAVEGEINSGQAARLAEALATVQARSFGPRRAGGSATWPLILRVTDRSAAGAVGASDTLRTYRCGAAEGPNTVRMLDEADGTEFVPEPGLADALAPWTGN